LRTGEVIGRRGLPNLVWKLARVIAGQSGDALKSAISADA
jgi:hypothetical protein